MALDKPINEIVMAEKTDLSRTDHKPEEML
jgi:hypothetical protein